MPICVLYAYFEKNQQYKDNLLYFLQHGLIKDVDYVIIVNGECTVEIPKSIKVIQRPNTGFDFGAWWTGIKSLCQEYHYYYFINSSMRGPFYPQYYHGTWTEIYGELFRPDVPLVGTTINVLSGTDDTMNHVRVQIKKRSVYAHIQSCFFGLTNSGLKFLIANNFFEPEETSFIECVANKEILMSQLFLNAGFNISCLLPLYRYIDYRLLDKPIVTGCTDHWFANSYFGSTLHPYETIFYKINRVPLPTHFNFGANCSHPV